jgi:hypothetical protein
MRSGNRDGCLASNIGLRYELRRCMWDIVKEFLQFLRQEKKWWLVPLVLVLLLLGIFLVFSASSPLAPLLYPLF